MRSECSPVDFFQPSKLTLEKAEAARKYIERKYSSFIHELKRCKQQSDQLQQKMTMVGLTSHERSEVVSSVAKQRTVELRKRRFKLSLADYQLLEIIGRGSFGEVRLCRDKHTHELVAIKRLKKQEMVRRHQISHVKLEREVLTRTRGNYIVELYSCFQDHDYLYFVMEYLPGGDYMGLLIQRDTLTELQTRFYLAQLILAVEEVHKHGYIHRDLKPDNMLIGRDGFIKLTDFGLVRYNQEERSSQQCTPLTKLKVSRKELHNNPCRVLQKRRRNLSKVGTPEYIAPEVFEEDGYDQAIDWWSIGIILYESLFGCTPFADQQPRGVCQKIINWNQEIEIPYEPKISLKALSLLQGLLCPRQFRMRADEIKNHPFFDEVDWNNLRKMEPPFLPQLASSTDIRYFTCFDEIEPWRTDHKPIVHKDYNFAVFQYKRQQSSPTELFANFKIQELVRKRRAKRMTTDPDTTTTKEKKKHGRKNEPKSLHKVASIRAIRQSYNPPNHHDNVMVRCLRQLNPQPKVSRLSNCFKSANSKLLADLIEKEKLAPAKSKGCRISTTYC